MTYYVELAGAGAEVDVTQTIIDVGAMPGPRGPGPTGSPPSPTRRR